VTAALPAGVQVPRRSPGFSPAASAFAWLAAAGLGAVAGAGHGALAAAVAAAPRVAPLYLAGAALVAVRMMAPTLLRFDDGGMGAPGRHGGFPHLLGVAAALAALGWLGLPASHAGFWLQAVGFDPLAVRLKTFLLTYALVLRVADRAAFERLVDGPGPWALLLFLALTPPYVVMLVLWSVVVEDALAASRGAAGMVYAAAAVTAGGELARGALPLAGGMLAWFVASAAWKARRAAAAPRVPGVVVRPGAAAPVLPDARITWDPPAVPAPRPAARLEPPPPAAAQSSPRRAPARDAAAPARNDAGFAPAAPSVHPTTAAGMAAHVRGALADADPRVRAQAALALAAAGGADAVRPLAAALDGDEDEGVRFAAAEALAALDLHEARAALRERRPSAGGALAWKLEVLLELGPPRPPGGTAPSTPVTGAAPDPPRLVELL
jgi:hypothetical protein